MTRFTVHSTHPESLHDGRMVPPDADVELTEEEQNEPHNQRLIEEGVLVDADEALASRAQEEPENINEDDLVLGEEGEED